MRILAEDKTLIRKEFKYPKLLIYKSKVLFVSKPYWIVNHRKKTFIHIYHHLCVHLIIQKLFLMVDCTVNEFHCMCNKTPQVHVAELFRIYVILQYEWMTKSKRISTWKKSSSSCRKLSKISFPTCLTLVLMISLCLISDQKTLDYLHNGKAFIWLLENSSRKKKESE